MPLHLKKLSVGSTSIESLKEWHQEVLARRGKIIHVTRSFPRRAEEILPQNGGDGGRFTGDQRQDVRPAIDR